APAKGVPTDFEPPKLRFSPIAHAVRGVPRWAARDSRCTPAPREMTAPIRCRERRPRRGTNRTLDTGFCVWKPCPARRDSHRPGRQELDLECGTRNIALPD